MTKDQEEAVEQLRVWIEDLKAMKAAVPDHVPNMNLKMLADAQIRRLTSTLETAIDVHGMNQDQRNAREIRESRGHF